MNEVAVQSNHSVAEVRQMAKALAESKLFGFKTEAEAFALMLIAQAEGRHPATIAQEYDVIQGRPALKSLAALARFQLAGGSVRWIASDATQAEAEFSHDRGGLIIIRWDMERANMAGLNTKDNWRKFPDQMLRARCAAEGVRAVFPACLNGMYVSEEVQDFEPRKDAPARKERPAPIETPHVELAGELEKAKLLADMKSAGIPFSDVKRVIDGTSLEEMTVAQFETLSGMLAQIQDPRREESTTIEEGNAK